MMRLLDLWWLLRSTTGSYGRPEIEITYGKTVISIHRGYLGDVSLGRVVRVSTWCITHGRHTRVNTSVGTVYVFLTFNTNSIRIMFWKSICIMKRHWWSLTLSWPDDDQGMILTAHNVFLKRNERIHRFIIIVSLRIEIDLYTCFIHTTCMTTCYYMLSLSFFSMFSLWLFLSITEHMVCSHSYCIFLQASHHHFESNSGGQDLFSFDVLWLGSYAKIVFHWICQDFNYYLSICTVLMFYFRF